MEAVLGKDWKQLFDLCFFDCKKPLFHLSETPFYSVDTTTGTRSETSVDIETSFSKGSQFFTQGNSYLATRFFQKHLDKKDVKIAFLSSQYFTDIQAIHEL
jgi:hypothetical protein